MIYNAKWERSESDRLGLEIPIMNFIWNFHNYGSYSELNSANFKVQMSLLNFRSQMNKSIPSTGPLESQSVTYSWHHCSINSVFNRRPNEEHSGWAIVKKRLTKRFCQAVGRLFFRAATKKRFTSRLIWRADRRDPSTVCSQESRWSSKSSRREPFKRAFEDEIKSVCKVT